MFKKYIMEIGGGCLDNTGISDTYFNENLVTLNQCYVESKKNDLLQYIM